MIHRFSKWVGLNIMLQLSPLFLRIFISIFGRGKVNIIEPTELLFISIFTCVIAININPNKSTGCFESMLKIFLIIIATLNLIVLAMIYSNNASEICTGFSIVTVGIAIIITPIYKLFYISKESGENNEF